MSFKGAAANSQVKHLNFSVYLDAQCLKQLREFFFLLFWVYKRLYDFKQTFNGKIIRMALMMKLLEVSV